MNRQTTALLAALCVMLLTGCAGMQGPPEDLLKRVPVIEIGKPEPADKNYILYIPGGKTIPVQMTVKGPLIVNPGEATTRIQLTQSLYLYKEWSSLDGRNWTHQAFQGRVAIGLAPQGGIVEVFVNRPD
ncbi:MAG: hypothetical protein K2X00_18645 [Nitrospiraceae bacterium]|nr:hypothetical protein [Nitrospiraceae bacterium]OQW65279.1 MAG: hypothetical protein BVN29_09660 [Nitrospira sp. ST-bin5]